MTTFKLTEHPVHLGLGATAEKQPKFEGSMEWYMAYGARHSADGVEGRLVAVHTFESDWPTWEMHPKGAELVFIVDGAMTLVQEIDGERRSVLMKKGDAAINPPGVWHTAKVQEPTTALFITAGEGTQNEVRD